MGKEFDDKGLISWQIVSFISRGIAMAIGVLQSFFIVRILTVGEWGLVQIAASIGGALGIYQHLGLASGSTREISAAKDDTEIFKIFTTSLFIRYLITLPMALGLYFFAGRIAIGTYHQEILVLPLKIYAFVMLAQGAQSILNSVISGTKKFKRLFTYQAVIAILSVVLYLPLVYLYRVPGYFFAMLAFNIFSTFSLAYLALAPLKAKFALPGKHEFKMLLKELLSISLAIYLVKVFYTMWEKSGPIILGTTMSPELVGIFAFGMLYAKKINAISDAVTDVNLPVMSDKFVHDHEHYRSLFSSNFNKIFTVIMLGAFTAVYWFSDIVHLVVGSDKYSASTPLIFPMVFAFVFYSFMNIIQSSVLVPAKMIREMVLGFGALLIVTVACFFGLKGFVIPVLAMSYSMWFGAMVGFLVMIYFSGYKLKFSFINLNHILILVQCIAISISGEMESLVFKLGLFLIFLGLFAWAVELSKFMSIADFKGVFSRFIPKKV